MSVVKKRNLCQSCAYYYVTWDKNFPHGCQIMNFKSRQLPCLVTQNVSNDICLSYQEKQKPVRE